MTANVERPVPTGYRPLTNVNWYKRLHAKLIARGYKKYEIFIDETKRTLFHSLTGRVLELGPGGGANLTYFPPAIEWIGVEPNSFFSPYLRAALDDAKITGHTVVGQSEYLPIPSATADAVVCTLVLCTVHDPARTLLEVLRVLKPGGRLFFIEHVLDPEDEKRRRLQRRMRWLWEILGDGCQPHRDTAETIRKAGFTELDYRFFRVPLPVVGPHIAGSALKPKG